MMTKNQSDKKDNGATKDEIIDFFLSTKGFNMSETDVEELIQETINSGEIIEKNGKLYCSARD